MARDRLHRAGGARGGRSADGRRGAGAAGAGLRASGPDSSRPELAAELDPFAARARRSCPRASAWAPSSIGRRRAFPRHSRGVSDILLLPQYWAWRLSGVKATEVTSLGAHTPSLAARARDGCRTWCIGAGGSGGSRPCAAPGRRWVRSGPSWRRLPVCPPDCRVLAGIHDSNASYLPHLVARDHAVHRALDRHLDHRNGGRRRARTARPDRGHAGQCRRVGAAGADGAVHGRARGRAAGRGRRAAGRRPGRPMSRQSWPKG